MNKLHKMEKEEENRFEEMRKHLIKGLEFYISDEKVRKAMLRVPRHKFVPEYEQKKPI